MRRFEIDLTARLLGHLLQGLRPAEGSEGHRSDCWRNSAGAQLVNGPTSPRTEAPRSHQGEK